MPQVRPMLDDTELQQVQTIDVDGDQVLLRHSIPGLEGDFLQRLNRRASRIRLSGVLTGATARDDLKTLRDKYRAGDPVSFVADITTATRIGEVLIQELNVRELAGKPERFEYAFLLREYQPPPPPPTPVTPITPPPPYVPITQQVGNLIVEVIVEGQPNYDFDRITVTVQGTQQDGTNLPERTLTNRTADNIWEENNFPAGSYTAEAVAAEDGMTGSETAEVRPGETEQVTITLRPGTTVAHAFIVHFTFDRAFIEPCLMHVLKRVADYAQGHSDKKLVIVGHTDEVGSQGYNISLGDRRARTAYAALTYGAAPDAAVDEWNEIRRPRPVGETPSIHEGRGGWGIVEYQYMLQDLGFYPGNVDGQAGPLTDHAITTFQQTHTADGLTADGIIGDDTWRVLINEYLLHYNLNIPATQFLPNCKNEILKWLSCGELMPLPTTPRPCSSPAWRPNRRTELLFTTADTLPCPVPQPVTFDLPPPDGIGGGWCVGPGDPDNPCCFVTRDSNERNKWLIQPAEAGSVTVQGTIHFEDGSPAANVEYILIAPDGKYLHKNASGGADDGEIICGNNKGSPNPIRNRTDSNGQFDHPDPTPVGVYTLEIRGPYVARAASDTSGTCNGNVVCQHLDGSAIFDVIVFPLATTFDLQVTSAVQIGGPTSTDYLALRADTEYVIVTAVFPTGTCTPPSYITWTGGEEVPNSPSQRRVSRAANGDTTITATMTSTGITRSVTITVATLQITQITFNHDAARATTDAFNIRRNATAFIATPEWQQGTSVDPQDTLAAYSIQGTQGNTITVQTRFQLSTPTALPVEIRAVAPTAHVMGEVTMKSAALLPTGATNPELFNLQNVQIWSQGVGRHDIAWNWQARLQASEPWVAIGTTQARIYVVLEEPNLPWQQTPHNAANTQLPWVEVLDYACQWAASNTDVDTAAASVTADVYALGTTIIEYDCAGGGGTHYASPDFNCTAFLERLGGSAGNGRYVNCSDCATIVSTFANILGADLWQSRMGDDFDLNPILAIGSTTWQTACNWGGFSYHEVAWKGACSVDEEVFDACLQVDGDSDPTAAPHTALLPTNMRFGSTGDGDYRDHLAADTPSGRPNCNPQPATTRRHRRVI